MTPGAMARIHAAAFAPARGWTATEFSDLLGQPFVSLFETTGGFALTRTLAGESELLTLAVDPGLHRGGIGSTLVNQWIKAAAAEAETAFLEVAADNLAALALYEKLGFAQNGRRKAYYARGTGTAVDALLYNRALTRG